MLLESVILSESIPLSMSHDLTAAIVSFDGAKVCLICLILAMAINQEHIIFTFSMDQCLPKLGLPGWDTSIKKS